MPLGRVDGTRSAGRVAPVYIVQAPLGRVDGTRSAGRSTRLVIVGASANAIHTRAAPMESRPCVRAARSLITERQRSERFSDRREKANSTIGRKCGVLAALGVIKFRISERHGKERPARAAFSGQVWGCGLATHAARSVPAPARRLAGKSARSDGRRGAPAASVAPALLARAG